MTVKVVRGLVTPVNPANAAINSNEGVAKSAETARPAQQTTQPTNGQAAATPQQTALQVSNQAATSEAVITNLKSSRSNQSPEKIKEYKEARSLAKDTASKILSQGKGSIDAHSGLDSGSAQAVL